MSNRKPAERMHPAAFRAVLDSEIRADPRDWLERAKAAWLARENEQVRQWLAAYLERTNPDPGQQLDTQLGTKIGLKKGSTEVARFYARTHSLRRQGAAVIATAYVNCNALAAGRLRKAFARAGKISLRQMRDPDTRAAGHLVDHGVVDDSVVRLRLFVSDATAITKLASRTYSGVVVAFDGDEVADISLVDAPVDFVGEFSKRSPEVIAKVFGGYSMKSRKLAKKAAKLSRATGQPYHLCLKTLEDLRPVPSPAAPPPVLSPSAERALAQKAHADALAASGAVEGYIAKALQRRAADAVGLEFIKAARSRPVAYGDGLVDFLRHGRP
jgi:hypothetical protein